MLRAALVWLVLVSGCGAGPTFRQGVFRDGDVVFQVGRLGDGWRRVEVSGSDLAFHSRNVGGVIAVNGDCDRDNDPPLRQLLMQLLIGFTEREFLTEELMSLDGREAMHSIVRAKIDGVPMMLDLYVLKKDECLYDFSYVAPPRDFLQARAEFEAFVRGFAAPIRRNR